MLGLEGSRRGRVTLVESPGEVCEPFISFSFRPRFFVARLRDGGTEQHSLERGTADMSMQNSEGTELSELVFAFDLPDLRN